MSNEEENDKSAPWWSTAPKLFAAVASLLTAATGLILAAHQLGYLKSPEVGPGPSAVRERPAATRTFFMERPVDAEDLAGMSDSDLDLLRNEIYARHGRRFNRKDLQEYFDQQPWYKPLYAPDEFPTHLLTGIQQRNVMFISTYRQQRMQHP